MRRHILKTLAVLFVVVAVSAQAGSASAQAAAPAAEGDRIDADIAGIIGLGLLGAEVGLLIPPTVKLHDQWWAWVLFPTLGAGGGAAAGALALDGLDSKVQVAILGVGMGLLIPALVGSLAIKSRRERQAFEQADQSVMRFGRLELDSPSVAAAPVYSASEQSQWGVRQRTSLRFSLLSGRF